MHEGIGEQHQQRHHQAIDRHRLDHGQADEQGARERIGRFRLAGDGVHRGGDGAALRQRRPDGAERDRDGGGGDADDFNHSS